MLVRVCFSQPNERKEQEKEKNKKTKREGDSELPLTSRAHVK